MFIRALSLFLAALALACGDLPPPPVGQLRLGLSSGIGELQYRLAHATFAIDGAAQVTLESDDEPESDVLSRALPEGGYSVELLEGWRLERASSREPVAAELSSGNPLPFIIAAGELTTVTFQFRTLDADVPRGGDGEVRIAIEVDGVATPRVRFSEFMKNPAVLADADGEWIELYNAGGEAVDLAGCALSRDDQALELQGPLLLEPAEYLTLANGDAPGFVPDVLYSGLTLPNTGAFALRLACAGTVLDELAVDATLPTPRAGRSLSLSAAAVDGAPSGGARWCEGSTSYNGDYGTPGAANPACAP